MPAPPADPPPDPPRARRPRPTAGTRSAAPAPGGAIAQPVTTAGRPRPKNPAARRAVGDVIRALRKRRGWSQERLALECGYDRAYVGQLERGQRWPTVEAVWYVLYALGADWSTFGAAMDAAPALAAPPAPREGRPRTPDGSA